MVCYNDYYKGFKMKTKISEWGAVLRLSLAKCDCNHPHLFIKWKFISPKTNLWQYDIRCEYCGKIHYKSDGKEK